NCLTTRRPKSQTGVDPTWILDDKGFREPTPVEWERLQGFPDGWTESMTLAKRYKQMGNAVTVNVIEEIVKRLKISFLESNPLPIISHGDSNSEKIESQIIKTTVYNDKDNAFSMSTPKEVENKEIKL
ncbi:MAG TPA: DNA cytosine methyltransferase, partial [Candidatus Nanoarchaeia archaeon]|nr:DNA cytosine methyltransferase [Candidatus Nanoarchaeia archaeon]